MSVRIFGIDLFEGSAEALFRQLSDVRRGPEALRVHFVNVHVLMEAAQDPGLEQILSTPHTLNVMDGTPLAWIAAHRLGRSWSRIPGPDFMRYALEHSSGQRHGFIGGTDDSVARIAHTFGIEAVHYAPPFRPFRADHAREDWDAFVRICGSIDHLPNWIWVGLGAPKQEYWMAALASSGALPSGRAPLFLGVGAAFDFLSGRKARAPEWMRSTGLEWLYRLLSEPKRMARRYFLTNSRFLARCARAWLAQWILRDPSRWQRR